MGRRLGKPRKPFICTIFKECECRCGMMVPERDKQYRTVRFIKNHDKKREPAIIYCACGCNQSLADSSRKQYPSNKNYRKRKYIAGHQNRKPRNYGNQIKCLCGCGQSITEYRYHKNGKRNKVKYQVGHNRRGAQVTQFWKGGKTDEAKRFKQSGEYKRWRKAVFERDNYTCVLCGARNGKGVGKTIELHPDHIKPFSQYPELRTELSNGRTLCIDCHRKTDTYGIKLVHSSRQNSLTKLQI